MSDLENGSAFVVFYIGLPNSLEVGDIVDVFNGRPIRLSSVGVGSPYGVVCAVAGEEVVVQRRGLVRVKVDEPCIQTPKRSWWRRIFS